MRFLTNKEGGFSLVEIVVAVAIFVIVAIASVTAFLALSKSSGLTREDQDLNQASENIISNIVNEAKFATGAKETTGINYGRVWPPFMTKVATKKDTSFDEGSIILIITNTDNGMVKYRVYGTKIIENIKRLVLLAGPDYSFPTDAFNGATQDLTDKDISIDAFDISITPSSSEASSYNWVAWNPLCDLDGNGKIQAQENNSCPLISKNSIRSTSQPLLTINQISFINTASKKQTKTTIKTSVSSRDYDFDN